MYETHKTLLARTRRCAPPCARWTDDMAALLRERFVQTQDNGKELLSKRRSASYKRESLEAARKSMDALLSMKFVFLSETLRELAYEQLTFSIRRTLHKKIAEWYEYTYSQVSVLGERCFRAFLHTVTHPNALLLISRRTSSARTRWCLQNIGNVELLQRKPWNAVGFNQQ